MNLREFCTKDSFQNVLITTFNFDPLFFERVVLQDLKSGGANKIVVLADEGQAMSAIQSCKGQLTALGREYRVLPIKMTGAFHPKICLKLSSTDAMMYCGSSNLSRSGWLGTSTSEINTGNREIGMIWRIEPNSPEVSIIQEVQAGIQPLLQTEIEKDIFCQLFHYQWVKQSVEHREQDWKWLLTGTQKSLSSELEVRWRGRQFDSLRMVSGSTDESAAMIRWASKTFGIKKATLEIDITRCSFDREKLKNIPVNLEVKPLTGSPHTHLKVALFESKNGSSLVAGSANCSGAGWLRTKAQNGNIESVVVYDSVKPKDISHLFMNNVKGEDWKEIEFAKSRQENSEDKESNHSYYLKRLVLDRECGTVETVLSPKPELNSTVELEILSTTIEAVSKIKLKRMNKEGLYKGMQPDIPLQQATVFARGLIHQDGGKLYTNIMWIDELDQLRLFNNKKIPINLRNMQRGSTSSQNNAHLANLGGLLKIIHDSRTDYSDVILKLPTSRVEKSKDSTRPVSPEDLITSIDNLKPRHDSEYVVNAYGNSLSFSGILGTLFFSEEQSRPEMSFDPTESEHKISEEEKGKDAESDDEEAPQAELVDPTESQRRSLMKQLQRSVDALQEPIFAEKCEAHRLREAVLFPIAVARWTYNSPWMSKDVECELSRIVRETCEILLLRRKPWVGRGKKQVLIKPLIEEVYERYLDENRVDVFNYYIGIAI